MPIVDLDASLAGDSSLAASGKAQYTASATFSGATTLAASLSVVTGYAAPVRYAAPARAVPTGRLIFDQVDLFLGDGKTRVQEVAPANLLLRLYVDGTQLSWPLVSGVGVPDVQIAAGKVYWTEFSAGFYNVRFFPNKIGNWRLLLTYPLYDQAVSFSYDVTSPATGFSGSLRSSFTRRSP